MTDIKQIASPKKVFTALEWALDHEPFDAVYELQSMLDCEVRAYLAGSGVSEFKIQSLIADAMLRYSEVKEQISGIEVSGAPDLRILLKFTGVPLTPRAFESAYGTTS